MMKNSYLVQIVAIFSLGLMTASTMAGTKQHRLSWDSDPAHSAVIGFSPSGKSINPYVRYGYSTDEETWTTQSYTYSHLFQFTLKSFFVRLTGLTPNSPVYYRVCDQDGCGDRFWFRTAPVDDSPYVVVAGGDTRSGWENRRRGNRLVAKVRPLFIMHGGDYSLLNTMADMRTFLTDWQLTFSNDIIDGIEYKRIYPFIPTHGNHEDNDYYTLCIVFGVDYNQDGKCNSLDTFGGFNISPLLRVYTLNSQFNSGGQAPRIVTMNEWLVDDLATNQNAAVWRFAQYHKPMFPHYSGKSNNLRLFDWWSDAFYQYGMNLVVESDTHINKVTRPVKPVVNNGERDFEVVEDGGIVFVGEGSWGAPARSANQPKDWTIDLASVQQFKVIQVKPDELIVRTALFDETAQALTPEQRSEDPIALPADVNWWLANELGDHMRLTKAANNLSLLNQEENPNNTDGTIYASMIASSDASISKTQPDLNLPQAEDHRLIADTNNKDYGRIYSLVKFDLSALPSCINSHDVRLQMGVTDRSTARYRIYAATQDWQEDTVTWNSVGGDAIKGELIGSFVPNKNGIKEVDLSQSGIVEKWLADGNFGLVIVPTRSSGELVFHSKETGDSAVLKLTYDDSLACVAPNIVEANTIAAPATRSFNRGSGEKVVLNFALANESESHELSEISIKAAGDLDETTLGEIGLYADSNNNGQPEASEKISSGSFQTDNGEIVFTLEQPYAMSVGDNNFLITYQF